jgi:hypothetical protein
MQGVECRMMNGEVFEIAQELLKFALCIRHSAFDPCKIEDRVMASRHDLKRNILLRTIVQTPQDLTQKIGGLNKKKEAAWKG